MNIMTFSVLLLIAVVVALAGLLLLQRQRLVSAGGSIIDPAEWQAAHAGVPAEQPTVLRTAKGMDLMDASNDGAVLVQSDRIEPVFAAAEAQDILRRWDAIQASFVDEPRKAVDEAERLIAGAVRRLSDAFSQGGANGGDISTEDLRLTLKRHKAFLGRLL